MLGDLFSRRLGDTDCEAFRSGFFAQPANVTSSFAFVIVGGAFAVWALRQGAGRRLLPLIYAGFIAANGVGGMLFHGPAWTGSAWIHDLALVGSLVFILLYDVRALRPMTTVQFLGAGAVILAVLGMTLAGAPQTANLLNAVFGALVLGTELVAARERYAYRKARQAYAVLIAALVVGGGGEPARPHGRTAVPPGFAAAGPRAVARLHRDRPRGLGRGCHGGGTTPRIGASGRARPGRSAGLTAAPGGRASGPWRPARPAWPAWPGDGPPGRSARGGARRDRPARRRCRTAPGSAAS